MLTHLARRPLIAGFVLAIAASAFLWFVPPYTSGERVDLESLVPYLNNEGGTATVSYGRSSGDVAHSSWAAGLLLIGLTILGGMPLLAPRSRPVLLLTATLMTLFVIATILRNGLFYIPSAVVLCLAAVKARASTAQSG